MFQIFRQLSPFELFRSGNALLRAILRTSSGEIVRTSGGEVVRVLAYRPMTPAETPEVEYQTADGIYFQTADSNYYGTAS